MLLALAALQLLIMSMHALQESHAMHCMYAQCPGHLKCEIGAEFEYEETRCSIRPSMMCRACSNIAYRASWLHSSNGIDNYPLRSICMERTDGDDIHDGGPTRALFDSMSEHILASQDSPFTSVIMKHTSLGACRTPYRIPAPHTIAVWSDHIENSMPTGYDLPLQEPYDLQMRRMCLLGLLCRHIVCSGGCEIVELGCAVSPVLLACMLNLDNVTSDNQANGTTLHRHIACGCIHALHADNGPAFHTMMSMHHAIVEMGGEA